MNMVAQFTGDIAPADGLQWCAVLMKQTANPNRRTVVVDQDPEQYRNRKGAICVRGRQGTGRRVFVHERILSRAGFAVVMPLRWEFRQKSRYSKDKKSVAYPLLGSWLFVGWPVGQSRWSDLMATNIVAGVAGTGGKPLLLTGHNRERFEEAFKNCNYQAPDRHKYMRSGREFVIGDRVTVEGGPFVGFPAQVVDIEDEISTVLVDIFGRAIPVEVPSYDLALGE
ncbi:MAG: hypothetical protein ABJO67_03270 [Pseudoruegeria sp.]